MLDPRKTSPYAFYQFWMNTSDADVYRFLRFFTFLPLERIGEIESGDESSGTRPAAQGILAREVTELVHGRQGLESGSANQRGVVLWIASGPERK